MLFVIRKNSFITEDVAGETIVFTMKSGEARGNFVMVFNETGAFLWNSILEEVSIEKLSKAFSQEYGIEIGQAEEDVMQFLKKCEEEEMIQLIDC